MIAASEGPSKPKAVKSQPRTPGPEAPSAKKVPIRSYDVPPPQQSCDPVVTCVVSECR